MTLTKLTNIHGDFEYINLERVTSVIVRNDSYELTMTDGSIFTVAKADVIITDLIATAATV